MPVVSVDMQSETSEVGVNNSLKKLIDVICHLNATDVAVKERVESVLDEAVEKIAKIHNDTISSKISDLYSKIIEFPNTLATTVETDGSDLPRIEIVRSSHEESIIAENIIEQNAVDNEVLDQKPEFKKIERYPYGFNNWASQNFVIHNFSKSWLNVDNSTLNPDELARRLALTFANLSYQFEPLPLETGICEIRTICFGVSDGYQIGIIQTTSMEESINRFSRCWNIQKSKWDAQPLVKKEYYYSNCVVELQNNDYPDVMYWRGRHVISDEHNEYFILLDTGDVFVRQKNEQLNIWLLPKRQCIQPTAFIEMRPAEQLEFDETSLLIEQVRSTSRIDIVGFDSHPGRMPYHQLLIHTAHNNNLLDKQRSTIGAVVYTCCD